MSLNQPIRDLKKAESIPQGTTYVASMGDGSGVKAVTQEVLTQAVGETLKVGNLEELQTEEKESLVGAINEIVQSGESGSVDILDSKEEIEANTEAGKAAGALAMKEMFGALNDNLDNIPQFVYDSNGQITGYKTKAGADTVFPFNRGFKEVAALWGKSGDSGVGGKVIKSDGTMSEDGTFMKINSGTPVVIYAKQSGFYVIFKRLNGYTIETKVCAIDEKILTITRGVDGLYTILAI